MVFSMVLLFCSMYVPSQPFDLEPCANYVSCSWQAAAALQPGGAAMWAPAAAAIRLHAGAAGGAGLRKVLQYLDGVAADGQPVRGKRQAASSRQAGSNRQAGGGQQDEEAAIVATMADLLKVRCNCNRPPCSCHCWEHQMPSMPVCSEPASASIMSAAALVLEDCNWRKFATRQGGAMHVISSRLDSAATAHLPSFAGSFHPVVAGGGRRRGSRTDCRRQGGAEAGQEGPPEGNPKHRRGRCRPHRPNGSSRTSRKSSRFIASTASGFSACACAITCVSRAAGYSDIGARGRAPAAAADSAAGDSSTWSLSASGGCSSRHGWRRCQPCRL